MMQPLVQHVYVLRLSLGDRCKDYVAVIVSPVWNGLLEYLYMLSSLVSPGTVGKGQPTNNIPSDCSPVLSTPKRPAHSTVLATPSTRSRMYYSGFNSPAAIRWLCSPAMCPATRVGNRKRTSNPALSEQVTHNPEDEKERQVLTWVCGVCTYVYLPAKERSFCVDAHFSALSMRVSHTWSQNWCCHAMQYNCVYSLTPANTPCPDGLCKVMSR